MSQRGRWRPSVGAGLLPRLAAGDHAGHRHPGGLQLRLRQPLLSFAFARLY
ncbi:MAG: hypothetical protein KAI47_10425 [Deltaproteobacteria bacterium]|nr:hypothetical protein [Deltaproteobacteria bacterium]